MPRSAIALGSNLGDPLRQLQAARDALRSLAVPGSPFLQAPLFRSTPVDCPPDSPDFLNTVVELDFDGSPEQLLAATREIEHALGRRRGPERHAPRAIDLDLLYCGDQLRDTPQLELPHPRLGQRRFVLEPLAAIRPDLVLPGHTRRIAELLATLDPAEPPLERLTTQW